MVFMSQCLMAQKCKILSVVGLLAKDSQAWCVCEDGGREGRGVLGGIRSSCKYELRLNLL